LSIWQPFAPFQEPASVIVAETETELEDAILADIERMMFRERSSAKKEHLQRLVQEQIRRFRKEHEGHAQKRFSGV